MSALYLPSCPFQPVIGCDPNLRMNLETFFRLDYPKVRELGLVSQSVTECGESLCVPLAVCNTSEGL